MSSATNHFGLVSHHDYLHQDGWKALDRPLHQQSFVINAMSEFHKNRVHGSRDNAVCIRRPGLRDIASILTVAHVTDARETRDHPSFSLLRMAWILAGPVPLSLEGLTQVEQMLIARGCPVMCVYRKKGGQCGYKNHVLNFPQDIQGSLDSCPVMSVICLS